MIYKTPVDPFLLGTKLGSLEQKQTKDSLELAHILDISLYENISLKRRKTNDSEELQSNCDSNKKERQKKHSK